MDHITWILLCGTLCILHAHSYVLLTANVEDVQSIAHQVAKSPLLTQIKKIWRRASKTFQNTLDKPKMRATDQGDSDDDQKDIKSRSNMDAKRDDKTDSASGSDDPPAPAPLNPKEARTERREAVEELINLGRNASVYLGSIKNIIDKI